jgi:hypothetical protein
MYHPVLMMKGSQETGLVNGTVVRTMVVFGVQPPIIVGRVMHSSILMVALGSTKCKLNLNVVHMSQFLLHNNLRETLPLPLVLQVVRSSKPCASRKVLHGVQLQMLELMTFSYLLL